MRLIDKLIGIVNKNLWAINILLLIAALLVFLYGCQSLWSFTIDDAFISFRYADNLAQGYGFSWNYDGHPESGFSNYLLVILCAGGIKLGADPVLFGKLLNVCMGIAAILLVGLIVREATGGKCRLYFFASLIFATIPAGWVHAVSGLETMMFTALIALSAYCYIVYLRRHSAVYLAATAVSLILTVLCRYEGGFIALGVLLHMAYTSYRSKKRPSAGEIALVLSPFVFTLLLLLWNYLYFGQILPNTFYAKTGEINYGVALSNWPFIHEYLLVLVPLLAVAVANYRKVLSDLAESFLALQFVLFLLPFLFMGQVQNYEFRFYYPVTAIVVALSVLSLYDMASGGLSAFKASRIARLTIVAAAVAVALILMLYPLQQTYDQETSFALSIGKSMENAHIKVGKVLGEFPALKDNVVATVVDAGAIPYYSRWQVYDYTLNDAYSVKHGFNVTDFYRHDPGVITLTFYQSPSWDLIEPGDPKVNLTDYLCYYTGYDRHAIVASPYFANYTFMGAYMYHEGNIEEGGYYIYVFVRDDLIARNPDLALALMKNAYFSYRNRDRLPGT